MFGEIRRIKLVGYIKNIIIIIIFRDLLDEIRTIKPGTVVHQLYGEASDIYAFPAKPQVSCCWCFVALRPR